MSRDLRKDNRTEHKIWGPNFGLYTRRIDTGCPVPIPLVAMFRSTEGVQLHPPCALIVALKPQVGS